MSAEAQDKTGEARRRLVATRALGLFARLGFEKVSFRDISKATGVPRTAIYRYFHTKREIFDAAIGGVLADLRTAINATLAERKPATARLSKVCSLVVDGLFENRDFLGAIFNFVFAMVTTGEDMSGRVDGFTGGLKRAFSKLLSEGLSDGSIRRSVDPEINAELLFALMESVAFNILLNLEKDSRNAKSRFKAAITAISA